MALPVLALVIGINKYASQDYDDLNGAVPDADAFEAYLTTHLGVPQENIISLRNEAASRADILDAFTTLRDSSKYPKGQCAIIIFYAGHGAQVEKPEEWEEWVTSSGKIEMLCPSDIGLPINDSDADEYDDCVQGIPDRTISTLLNHIAAIQGNNITLVLDCCSSGGINRSFDSDFARDHVPRQIRNAPPIKPNVDEKIWTRGSRGSLTSEVHSGKHSASHVLLAACGRDQFAYENQTLKRGMFTYTLLKVLENEDVQNLTYTSLMHKMKMPEQQTPHCEGQGTNWRLFNNTASGADDALILTKREKGGPTILHAGDAQGITTGSRFAVYANNLINTPLSPNPPLGNLIVTSVSAFSSTLGPDENSPNFRPPRLCYSKLLQAADRKINIYSNDKDWLESVFPPDVLATLSAVIVADVSSCDLQLTVSDGSVYFDRYSPLVTPYLSTRIRHTLPAENIAAIQNIVKSSSHFYYHLTRTGPSEFRNVWMELKELKGQLSKDFDYIFTPTGKNLIEEEPAKVYVDEDANLGMTIFNQTDLPLYPYLFYFDPTDLTIIEWYKPPMGAGKGSFTTKVDVPLPPKSRLSLGYGDGGVIPWQFLLPDGEKHDLGFFKLFLTTRPAYFDSIAQEISPFEAEDAALLTRAGKLTAPGPPEEETWGAQLSTVVQLEKVSK